MGTTVTAIAVIVILAAWHLHNRRHPGWSASADGRFYIFSGYSLAVIAVSWLVSAPTATAWEWVLGDAWAFAAMVFFVCGFGALNQVAPQCARVAQALD